MRGKREKSRGPITYRLVIATLVSVLLLSHFSSQKQERTVLVPDLAPEGSEQAIEKIPHDTTAPDENASGVSVRLTYSTEVSIDLGKETVSLYFGNPGRSNQDMILQLIIQDEVIAQSDLIPSGYQLKTMPLSPDSVSLLQAGSYSGRFLIFYYDQKTDERAAINTEIPVTVTVE